MKSTSDISKTVSAKAKKLFWLLGLHAFSLILLLILIDLIIGGVIFYNYVFLAEQEVPKVTSTIIKFDDKSYQDVLAHLISSGQASAPAVANQPDNSQ